MNTVGLFFTGLVFTAGFMTTILSWLRNPLHATLADVCGSEERARFWTRFSLVILFLVPFALALGSHPVENTWPVSVYEVSSQLESAILGFSVALVILGWMITRVDRSQRVGEKSER